VCGFAGELTAGRPADAAAIARMTETMQPRGPDGVGLWTHGRIGFGHRRLKVIDLSERAAQPMVDSELGLTVVFNGCVYNHRELRAELEGHGYHFFSSGDTEVVLKAYHRWGDRCVERFAGMFAFAVAERDSGRLMLARDRLGVKPLYISQMRDGALRFASTLPALLAGGGVDTTLDPVALHNYLSWHSVVPAPRTILMGVRKLKPATTLTIEPDGRRVEREYWRPAFERDAAKARWSADDWAEAVLESLRVAVRRRMVSDVPVGVLLSGGLDSSLIVALLAEQGVPDLKTFSIGFRDVAGREGDEFRWSDIVAEQFATDHNQIRIEDDRMLPALGDAIRAMSEPMVSHDTVAFHLLSEEVSKQVKVVQSGQGADEVFAGYSWYQPLADVDGDGLDVYSAEFFDHPNERLQSLLGPRHRFAGDPSLAFAAAHFAMPGAATAVDRALRLDTQVMLVDDPVKRVDNMSMAFGLELRTPFLDHDLVELAAACPPELKLMQDGKGVLKEAARAVLGAEVIDRPKGYFPVPALRHLQGPYLSMVTEALRAPAARSRSLFDPEWVARLAVEPNEHLTTLNGNVLWTIGLLELWLQAHGIDEAQLPQASSELAVAAV
jgi:asparagine synthase (glutamine-hydrolysing)